jgi:SPP1 gp7 family putative phage head morphogenesis protein
MTPRKKLNEQRKRLLGRERAVILEMRNAYGKAWVSIKRELGDLTTQIQASRKAGESVNAAWLLRQRRLETVERTVAAEMRVLVDLLDKTITDAQMTAAFEGRMDAAELIKESMGVGPGGGMFDPVIPQLVPEKLIERVAAGSALSKRLGALGADAVRTIRQELLRGVLLGKNPRVVARGIRTALDGNRWRANVIARTEMLGVYRQAAAASYKANDVVTGWVWSSAQDERTCQICWAEDGSVHSDEETLSSHPCCRCAMEPRTKTWEQLGFKGIPESVPARTTGPERFATLPSFKQRAILGPGKFDLYKSGKLKLGDLPVKTRSDFGPGLRTKSLKELVS